MPENEEITFSYPPVPSEEDQDPDGFDIAWDDFLEQLNFYLAKVNPKDLGWYCEGQHLDWRDHEGHKTIYTNDAKEMLRAIIPDTNDWACRVWVEKDKIYFKVYHHDVPSGSSYQIMPLEDIEEDFLYSVTDTVEKISPRLTTFWEEDEDRSGNRYFRVWFTYASEQGEEYDVEFPEKEADEIFSSGSYIEIYFEASVDDVRKFFEEFVYPTIRSEVASVENGEIEGGINARK